MYTRTKTWPASQDGGSRKKGGVHCGPVANHRSVSSVPSVPPWLIPPSHSKPSQPNGTQSVTDNQPPTLKTAPRRAKPRRTPNPAPFANRTPRPLRQNPTTSGPQIPRANQQPLHSLRKSTAQNLSDASHSANHQPTNNLRAATAPQPSKGISLDANVNFAHHRQNLTMTARIRSLLTAHRLLPTAHSPLRPPSWHNECSKNANHSNRPPWASLHAHASKGRDSVVPAPITV
jgi:hypothetical protein